jgi:pimeloyl-ACP methyl ester carboxylesterase
MSAIAAGFAAAGYRAVAFDMPAHGESTGRTTSLAEWMRLLPVIAERSGGVHAVVGHSLGAAAVTLAVEAGLPARGVVLIAPPVGPMYFIERLQRFIGLPAERAPGMVRELVALVGRDMEFFDSARAARSISLPVLMLHDPADREVPWSHAESIADAWVGSELVATPGLGHYRILSTAQTVQRAVDFVAALDRAPTVGAVR